MCRSGLPQLPSSAVPAPRPVQPRAPPHPPDPVAVAVPLRAGRRLGPARLGRKVPPYPALPLGTLRALWERGRILPRAGFVSPLCNEPSRFPPPHRSRCRSPGSPQPVPSARFPAASPPAPGCAPGFAAPAEPRHPCVPAGCDTAGSRGRERWQSSQQRGMLPRRDGGARVPPAGEPRGWGAEPGGAEQRRGARVEAGSGSGAAGGDAGWALSRLGKGTAG